MFEFTYNSDGILTRYEVSEGQSDDSRESALANLSSEFAEEVISFEGNNVASIDTFEEGDPDGNFTYTYDNNPNPFRGEIAFLLGQFNITDCIPSFVSENNISQDVTTGEVTDYEYVYDEEGYPIRVTIIEDGIRNSENEIISFIYR